MTVKTDNPQPHAVERKNKSVANEPKSAFQSKTKNKPKLSDDKNPVTK